jgi:lipopolysaccharide/colanic/teichoic acid biosynthesis glycosyltransferase
MGRPQSITLSETATAPARVGSALRRGADIAVSGLLLVLSAPLLVVIAVLVRTTSHGPVVHRDAVAGRAGHTIELLSFRTQVDGGGTDAHARLRAVVGRNHAWTPVGHNLARLRLDRLPRLVNVLKGDTSLF